MRLCLERYVPQSRLQVLMSEQRAPDELHSIPLQGRQVTSVQPGPFY